MTAEILLFSDYAPKATEPRGMTDAEFAVKLIELGKPASGAENSFGIQGAFAAHPPEPKAPA